MCCLRDSKVTDEKNLYNLKFRWVAQLTKSCCTIDICMDSAKQFFLIFFIKFWYAEQKITKKSKRSSSLSPSSLLFNLFLFFFLLWCKSSTVYFWLNHSIPTPSSYPANMKKTQQSYGEPICLYPYKLVNLILALLLLLTLLSQHNCYMPYI